MTITLVETALTLTEVQCPHCGRVFTKPSLLRRHDCTREPSPRRSLTPGVVLGEAMLAAVDTAVDEGWYPNRAAVVHAGLRRVVEMAARGVVIDGVPSPGGGDGALVVVKVPPGLNAAVQRVQGRLSFSALARAAVEEELAAARDIKEWME